MESSLKDFLLTHYTHISNLWQKRSEMRIAFLRFYFIFLGGIVTVIGLLLKESAATISFQALLEHKLVQTFIFLAFAVGLLTFCLINQIRCHNLKCVQIMNDIGKYFDKDVPGAGIADAVTRPFLTNPHRMGGIDFTNSTMIVILNMLFVILFLRGSGISSSFVLTFCAVLCMAFHFYVWYAIMKEVKEDI